MGDSALVSACRAAQIGEGSSTSLAICFVALCRGLEIPTRLALGFDNDAYVRSNSLGRVSILSGSSDFWISTLEGIKPVSFAQGEIVGPWIIPLGDLSVSMRIWPEAFDSVTQQW